MADRAPRPRKGPLRPWWRPGPQAARPAEVRAKPREVARLQGLILCGTRREADAAMRELERLCPEKYGPIDPTTPPA